VRPAPPPAPPPTCAPRWCPPWRRPYGWSLYRLERAVTSPIHNTLWHGSEPVEVAVTATGGQVRTHVRDHGPGFPPAFLPHAFDRFTRADDARSGPGSGLGLAITADIARSCGGTYGVVNRIGGGADVWITLPAGAGIHVDHGV
jgi:signal transduction histidine kinase